MNNILIDRVALTCWFHLQLEEQLAIVSSLVETPVDSTLWRFILRGNRDACWRARPGEVIHNYGNRIDEKLMPFIGLSFYKTYTPLPLPTPEPSENAIHTLYPTTDISIIRPQRP